MVDESELEEVTESLRRTGVEMVNKSLFIHLPEKREKLEVWKKGRLLWFLWRRMVWCRPPPELQQLHRPAAVKCPFRLKAAALFTQQQLLFTQQSCLWRAGHRPRPHYVHTVERLRGSSGHWSKNGRGGAGLSWWCPSLVYASSQWWTVKIRSWKRVNGDGDSLA